MNRFDEKKQLQIDQVVAAPHEVRPGEKVRLTTVLVGDNGAEVTRAVDYLVPVGAPPGPLCFTVADGNVTNIAEYRQIVGEMPRSAERLVANVNRLRANTKAYVRVWRPEANFQLEGEDFPDPPPSLALILAGADRLPRRRAIRRSRSWKSAPETRSSPEARRSRWKLKNELHLTAEAQRREEDAYRCVSCRWPRSQRPPFTRPVRLPGR